MASACFPTVTRRICTTGSPTVCYTLDQIASVMAEFKDFDVLAELMAFDRTGTVVKFVAINYETTLGDSSAGLYYWSATSTADHDGTSVVKSNNISATDPGRWLRHI